MRRRPSWRSRRVSLRRGPRQTRCEFVDQFEQIRSEFARVVDGEVAVLEWTSTGRLRTGADISYRGVSVLDFDGDGRVTRFATYYDTTPFSAVLSTHS